jgi:hypothetical protein
MLVMDLEETEATNDCAGESEQQFNRPTELTAEVGGRQLGASPARQLAAEGSTG